jgi:hypothetical protein
MACEAHFLEAAGGRQVLFEFFCELSRGFKSISFAVQILC